MSKRREEWSFVLGLLLAAAVYVALRFELNHEYAGATWNDLSALRAPAPFGRRLLVPLLTRPLVLEGVSVRTAFVLSEFVAVLALGVGLRAALGHLVRRDWASWGALGLVVLLAPLFLVQLRWPVFYPYDTPALAFAAWTLAWVFEPRPRLLVLLAFFATLNRESYLLIAAGVPCVLGTQLSRRKLVSLALGLAVACVCARVLAFALTEGIAEPYGGELAFDYRGAPRFVNNLRWLASPANALVMLLTAGLAPACYFCLYRGVPERLRRVGTVAVALFAASFTVGNIYEPRAFGEAALLFYVPALRQLASRVPSTAPLVHEESREAARSVSAFARYQETWLAGAIALGLLVLWLR